MNKCHIILFLFCTTTIYSSASLKKLNKPHCANKTSHANKFQHPDKKKNAQDLMRGFLSASNKSQDPKDLIRGFLSAPDKPKTLKGPQVLSLIHPTQCPGYVEDQSEYELPDRDKYLISLDRQKKAVSDFSALLQSFHANSSRDIESGQVY